MAGDVREPDGADAPAVRVPCPVLVGRSRELAVLTDALDRAHAGRGQVVFLVGEAGIGKSRLVLETAASATDRGLPVLRGRAVPGSGASAFRPLTEALAPVAADAADRGDLASWLPALGAIVPPLANATAVDVPAAVRGEAVLRLLAATCPDGGVLVLEDLHWADPETVAIVEHLTDNLERTRVLCLVTVRSEAESAARELAGRVRSRRSAPVLDLQPLNDAQVAAMVFGCAGESDPELVQRVTSLGDGVPFLIEEMLVSPGLPASLADGVRARLAELADRDRDLMVTASAFGTHFDWRLLPAATALAEGDVVDALERGVRAQLLTVDGEGFRFRHALTAEAVFLSVTPPRRERVAAAALAALKDERGDIPVARRETAARVAERAGDAALAGALHAALGEDAFGRGALQTAQFALERSAALLPPGDALDAALERLVDVLVEIGRVDDAVAIGDEVVARVPGDRAARVQARLAAAAVTAARWDLVTERLASSRTAAGPAASGSLRAELALRDAEVALGVGDLAGAEASATSALELAAAEGLPEIECASLQLLGRRARRSSLRDAEQWFRRALSCADAHDLPVWRLRARHELGTIGLLERSEVEDLLHAQRLAESLGAMATVAILDVEIAAGYAGADDLDGAARHGEQAVRRGGELGLDLVVAWGWQHVAAVAAMRGQDERAAQARAAALAAAPGNTDIEGFVVGGALFAALVRDELDHALELADRMSALLRGSQTAAPAHHRAAWPVLLALAKHPEADAAIEEMESAGVGVGAGGRAWLTLARAILTGHRDGARAAAMVVEADAELMYLPLWRSLGRRMAAQAANADGWAVPSGWMREAETVLRGLGYDGAADACRRLRGGAEEPDVPAGWARLGITAREADVLRLVVAGCSNREIAERLYLSVRTVEKHVESLLRRTSTKSRTQLAHVVAST
jgi:DNA-binding CsgD family transcriptional regulator/tetratricopeptide (TPR) repeat protein